MIIRGFESQRFLSKMDRGTRLPKFFALLLLLGCESPPVGEKIDEHIAACYDSYEALLNQQSECPSLCVEDTAIAVLHSQVSKLLDDCLLDLGRIKDEDPLGRGTQRVNDLFFGDGSRAEVLSATMAKLDSAARSGSEVPPLPYSLQTRAVLIDGMEIPWERIVFFNVPVQEALERCRCLRRDLCYWQSLVP